MSFLGALAATSGLAAQEVPPDEDWRSLETPHFRLTFPARLEMLARRAGAVAEGARARLEDVLLDRTSARVELVLTDHADVSNGTAVVAPYPRVVIFARPPVDGFALSHFDDWIELVVVHELAHIHHLDVTGAPGRVLQALFGRVPAPWPFFPAQGAPQWVLEGLATWYESNLTGTGRVEGTYLDMMLRTAALEGRLETVDQASGGSPVWPSGQRSYAYGALVFDWLLERYGPEPVARFLDEVRSQWIPYRLNAAARAAFGMSFDEAWEIWRAERIAEAGRVAAATRARAPHAEPESLTDDARLALYPRVGPGGILAYARADGRSDTELRFRDGAGRRWGIRTNGAGTFDWAPDGTVILAQFQILDQYRLVNDLYRVAPSGRITRLTWGQRLEHPSVTPDGRHAWAVQTVPGGTRLVRVSLADGVVEPLAALPGDAHWGFPAVAPDGTRVAAVRWAPGRGGDVVLLDARDGSLVATVADGPALQIAPAWAPDGTLLWVSDRTGIPNLYAAAVDPGSGQPGPARQVTDVATGVGFPSVDPEGRWIHASLYRSSGWELARLPYDPSTWADPLPPESGLRHPGERADATSRPEPSVTPVGGRARPYTPWPTLRPRHWEPRLHPAVRSGGREILGPFLGLATGSRDVVGRHRLDVGVAFSTTGARPRGGFTWEYRGLGNPVLSFSGSQLWDAGGPVTVERQAPAPPGVDSLWVRERERRVGLDVTFLRNGWRRAWALGLGGGLAWEDRTLLDVGLLPSQSYRLNRPDARLGDLRLSLSTSSARAFELSVGTGAGWTAFTRLRTRREWNVPDSVAGDPGQDRGFEEALGALRAYRSFQGPGFADHVLAVQVAGGAARGPGADAFHFDVGGASGQAEPISGLSLFGGDALFFPVRGYREGRRSGRYAWTGSVEWRIPLALVNRGWGLVPVHLDRVHGAIFADAGNAWGPELGIPGYQRPRAATLVGLGAEVRLEVLAFFHAPLTLRLGAATPLVDGEGTQFYVRFGPAF